MRSYKLNDKLVAALGLVGLIVVACTPEPVAAQGLDMDKVSIVVHGVSRHSGGKVYNEVNTGVALRYQQSDNLSYQVGVYDNSYSRQTVYSTAQYTPLHLGNKVKLGGFVGLASGYEHISKLPVSGGLMADIKLSSSVTMTVRHVPKISKTTDSVTALEIGFRF